MFENEGEAGRRRVPLFSSDEPQECVEFIILFCSVYLGEVQCFHVLLNQLTTNFSIHDGKWWFRVKHCTELSEHVWDLTYWFDRACVKFKFLNLHAPIVWASCLNTQLFNKNVKCHIFLCNIKAKTSFKEMCPDFFVVKSLLFVYNYNFWHTFLN